MPTPTDYIKKGFLRVLEPAVSFLARHNVSPNAITTVGTLLTIAAGVVDAKVGVMQRPERIVLLSAPQALFGLFWNGWVLMAIIILLSVTAWITAVQRIAFVYRYTKNLDSKPIRMVSDPAPPPKAAGVSATRRAQ